MNSPINFFRKCLTVFVGAALSWATVTNPEVDRIASHLCGSHGDSNDVRSLAAMPNELVSAIDVEVANDQRMIEPEVQPRFSIQSKSLPKLPTDSRPNATPSQLVEQTVDNPALRSNGFLSTAEVAPKSPSKSLTPDERIEEISSRLKQLGASYLLLEKLPQSQGSQYRVRCDLARTGQPVKCCFEATRETPVDAMEDILEAVQAGSVGTNAVSI